MELKLTRPLIVFDVESTGLNVATDRIIELSYIKVYPDGHEESRTMRFNPGMPIPAASRSVHHITDDDVANCPPFEQCAPEIADVFSDCDLAGFSSNLFDIPILAQEMDRAQQKFDLSQSRFIDVQIIYHKKEKRDLAAACRFYCGREMVNHHNSMADSRTTLDVLKAQLDHYSDLENDVASLAEYTSRSRNVDLAGLVVLNSDNKPVINFGKYRGQLLDEALSQNPGYADWVMQRDFTENTKRVFAEAKKRVLEAQRLESQLKSQREPTPDELNALRDKFGNKH